MVDTSNQQASGAGRSRRCAMMRAPGPARRDRRSESSVAGPGSRGRQSTRRWRHRGGESRGWRCRSAQDGRSAGPRAAAVQRWLIHRGIAVHARPPLPAAGPPKAAAAPVHPAAGPRNNSAPAMAPASSRRRPASPAADASRIAAQPRSQPLRHITGARRRPRANFGSIDSPLAARAEQRGPTTAQASGGQPCCLRPAAHGALLSG